ncbi:S-layer homology domain-containing protein [Paenibacillus soyae]|uniref:S-layer homology domain-containing protein n=1 Tax=Paenibacillus soyae TaxID=2969249 RepID=A0A9X2SA73_9BACL|nr:S-layer homology domain-containing protein [Paenibacillus soyae]MCR2806284.1 S-layer homology domain-containing protein [Paenibacillus soyae]
MKRKFLLLCLSLWVSLSLMPYTVLAKDASFSLTLNNERPAVGENIQVVVTGNNLTDVYGYEINLTYEPSRLRYVKTESPMTGFSVPMAPKDGELVFAHTKVGKVAGESGKVVLATIEFKVIGGTGSKPTAIGLTNVELVKSDLTVTNHAANVSLNVTTAGKTFNDLNGHWAKQEIERAAGLGFVAGYADGTFRPQNHVTRAEFATMVSRAMELKPKGGADPSFADLDRIPDWAKPSVLEAQTAGVITGYEDATFRPDLLINRSEMAAMMMRTLDTKMDEGWKPAFADTDSIPVWAQPSVAAAAEAGLIKGRDNNKFVPAANATRAEAVVLILRLIDYKNTAEL